MLAIPTRHPLEQIPASFPAGRRWFAFYTHIRAETAAGESISELGYETFTPMEKRMLRQPKGKPRLILRALFPRYGFVQIDLNDAGWGCIIEVKEVVDLIRANSIPSAIPTPVIDSLRLADEVGIFDYTKPPKAGVDVEITSGPFAGTIGKIVKARADDRVDILMKILGSDRVVTTYLGNLRELEG